MYLIGPIKVAVIESDPVSTRASVLNVKSDFSRSGVYKDRRTIHGQYVFKGNVEIEYSYYYQGKVYKFKEDFPYTHILGILGKQGMKEVKLGLSDIEYLPIQHSGKYPSLHIVK